MVKVSIIIPVYNTQKYLRECLQSVTRQTLKETEIICIDDGSDDASPEILDHYAKKYENITVIHQANHGYGFAVNRGLESASGEYAGIVDSDDFVAKDMYERLYKTAKEENADIVRSDLYEIKRGKKGYKKNPVFTSSQFLDGKESSGVVPKEELLKNVGMVAWTGIYKLDFLKKNNIKYNESPGAAFQDNGFCFQTTMYAERIVFIRGAFYHYRKDNPGSSVNDKDKVFDICREYKYIKDLLSEKPDKKKLFFKYFIIQKFYAYIDAFLRIAEDKKIVFLRAIAEELSDDLKELESQGNPADDIDPYVLGEILRIVDSPEIYYYESTVDRLNRVYQKVHSDLLEVRYSPECMCKQTIKELLKLSVGVKRLWKK